MGDSPWTLEAESSEIARHDTVTLVDGSNFMLCGRSGDIESGVHGLFMLDTRVLSRWMLTIDGVRVEGLSVVVDGPFGADFVGRVNPGDTADAPLAVLQHRYVGRGLREVGRCNRSELAADWHTLLTAICAPMKSSGLANGCDLAQRKVGATSGLSDSACPRKRSLSGAATFKTTSDASASIATDDEHTGCATLSSK